MKKSTSKTDHRQAIVVLGMHRSGTSALAGTLNLLGCDIPRQLMPPDENNPSGYFESLAIYRLNDAILASAGTAWDDWQAFNPDWLTSQRAHEFLSRATEVLIEEFGESRFFVVKDPRMCRLLPFWLGAFEVAGIDPRIVLTHRNPTEVAASLEQREAWPLTYGVLLWLRHVLDAEAYSRGLPRFCTSYERVLDNWAATAMQMKETLEISFPRWSDATAEDVNAFLDGKLRHRHDKAASVIKGPFVSIWVRDTLEVLERWAETGEDAGDYELLDRIRAAFDTAAPLFRKLVRTARSAREEATEQNRVMTQQTHEIERLHGEVLNMTAERDAARTEAEAEAKILNGHIAHRDAKLTDQNVKYQEQIAALNAEIGNIQATLEAAQAENGKLTAERGAVETRAEQLDQNLRTALSRIEELDAEITDLRHDKHQLASVLRQRSAEVEDVGRENAENVAKVTQLSQRLETLTAEHERTGRESRMLRVRLEEQNRKDLTEGLARNRASLDARLAQVQAQVQNLTQQNQALLKSTSWRLTAPLRALVMRFRK
jgi:hypothetical protein